MKNRILTNLFYQRPELGPQYITIGRSSNTAVIFNFNNSSKTTQTLEMEKIDHLQQNVLQTKRTLLISGNTISQPRRIDTFRLKEGKFEKAADEISIQFERAQHRKVLDEQNNNVFILSGRVNKMNPECQAKCETFKLGTQETAEVLDIPQPVGAFGACHHQTNDNIIIAGGFYKEAPSKAI